MTDIASPSAETVTLESLDEDEIITSTEPEFFGEGPPGTTITITIESDPITDQTTISSLGGWNWSPPEGLSEGAHKITITWRDASGILRTLTRTFIVQASEGPFKPLKDQPLNQHHRLRLHRHPHHRQLPPRHQP